MLEIHAACEAMTDPQSSLIAMAAECRYNPLKWALYAWDWGRGPLEGKAIRQWQASVMAYIRDTLADPARRHQPIYIAVASGHGIGKTAAISMVCNWAMSCWDGAKVMITANTETQLRTKTSPEVAKWFKSAITADWFDISTQSIKVVDPKHKENWRLDFVTWSLTNTAAFQGLHNEGKIIVVIEDEASEIPGEISDVIQGALTDEGTVIIWLKFGNPTSNTGRFRECFRRFRHRWKTYHIDSRTVEGTNKDYFEQLRQDHGEDSDFFKVRVRGEFPSQSANQFIGGEDVDAARNRHLRPDQYQFAPVIIGVDPAWTGDDSFEIMLRQGLYSRSLRSVPRNDNDVEMANIIAHLETEHNADAVFVDAGYGTGIVSIGRTMGRTWQLVWFASKPNDPGYLNKRAEIWGMGKRWLREGGVIDPRDDVLYQDLIGPETVPRMDGRIQLESKEDMKERGVPSPNKADALMLTFAQPVVKRMVMQNTSRNDRDMEDYDPLASMLGG